MAAKSKTQAAWELLFERYNISCCIEEQGHFEIAAKDIKKEREPRLMTKFDHSEDRPPLLKEADISILPLSRYSYVLGHYDAYHKLEKATGEELPIILPEHIQSFETKDVNSEAIELNKIKASGVLDSFLEDEELIPTVPGKMGSGSFSFYIGDTVSNNRHKIDVDGSQIEIDGAFEGINYLSLFEVKNRLADDFLVRQLYYPYRVWKERVSKDVKTIYMMYSNGKYHLYLYEFEDPEDYNSLKLIKQQTYVMRGSKINSLDIQTLQKEAKIEKEPQTIAFPQADVFERIINLCELLQNNEMHKDDVTDEFLFDPRQTNYYADAAAYLGLIDKKAKRNNGPYKLSKKGKKIMGLPYREKQLAFSRLILSHKPFNEVLNRFFETGEIPKNDEIVRIMKDCRLNKNLRSDSTYSRRAQTVSSWVKWIVGTIEE